MTVRKEKEKEEERKGERKDGKHNQKEKRKNTRKKSPFEAGTFVFPNIEPLNYHGSLYFKLGSFKREI